VFTTEDEKISEFNRITEWITENRKMWDRLIGALGDDTAFKDDTYIKIITELKERQFYQLILIMFHANNFIVSKAIEMAVFEILFKKADKKFLDGFIETVIKNLEIIKKN
jgi:hypothetical protein